MTPVTDLDVYQARALDTAFWLERDLGIPALVYCALKLSGEAGEFSEKVGKLFRDSGGELTKDVRENMAQELGDVSWYIASLAALLGYSLSDIATMNLEKLADRKARGTLQGEGDAR
jgi:NTP pyrophosphatase (non-canonical NTP hydrolase)